MRLKRLLPILVAVPLVLALAFVARAQAAKPSAPAGPATAEVKVGTGVEKMELQGESASFKVAAGTKIYAWTKVAGAADTTIRGRLPTEPRAPAKGLRVPGRPSRTSAYGTFRKVDEGAWTAKVVGADGAELGSASFTVEIQ